MSKRRMHMEQVYDLAFSFAGEDRDYARQVKEECEKLGLSVYYDQDQVIEQWGKSILEEQREVYGYKTRHVVPFISKHYFNKPIPTDEFKSALMSAIKHSQYILPVKMDDTLIPAKYLHEHTQYVKAEDFTPPQLEQALKRIVDGGKGPAKEIGKLLSDELELAMPKITPRAYNKFQEAESLLEYLANQFKKHLPRLEAEGYAPIVRHRGESVRVQVEKDGRQVSVLNLFFSNMGQNDIGFNYDGQSMMANSSSQNGHIEPVYDKESRTAAFKMVDYGNFGGEAVMSKEEIMRYLWDKVGTDIERSQERW
jgi:hypothetical protein